MPYFVYNSPSSTCTWKFICIQEKSQKWTNMKQRRQVDVAGGHGPTVPHWSTPKGIARRPHPPCHVTYPREGLHTTSPPLIHVGLIQRTTLSSHGSLGPLSLTRKAQTNLQIVSPGGKITYLPCNHHLEAIQRHGMVRWCNGRSIERGQCRPMPHHFIFAYKYPHALYTL